MLIRYYGMFLSLFHSVQICQPEGIPLEQFITLLGEQGRGFEKWLCENLLSDKYQETAAPLELWAGAIENITWHAQECNMPAEFPMLAARLSQKTIAAGYGREEVLELHSRCCRNHRVKEWTQRAGFDVLRETNGEIWCYHILVRKI